MELWACQRLLSSGTQVQDQVKAWNDAGHRGKKLMCTARPPWVTMSARIATFKKDCNMIKCNLRDIIWVDLEKEVRPISSAHAPSTLMEGSRDPVGERC